MDTDGLAILYDERCAFCRRCRDWLATQPILVAVELLPAGSEDARARFGGVPWLGSRLVVADGTGRVWVGSAAFLMCLWATARYRSWSYLLNRPWARPFTERFFRYVSANRDRYAKGPQRTDRLCAECHDVSIRAHR